MVTVLNVATRFVPLPHLSGDHDLFQLSRATAWDIRLLLENFDRDRTYDRAVLLASPGQVDNKNPQEVRHHGSEP